MPHVLKLLFMTVPHLLVLHICANVADIKLTWRCQEGPQDRWNCQDGRKESCKWKPNALASKYFFTHRTFITSGSTEMSFSDAQNFCYEQNTKGLVVWDSEEKYNDVFFIADIDGENRVAWTALTNQDNMLCSPANQCTNKLVTICYAVVSSLHRLSHKIFLEMATNSIWSNISIYWWWLCCWK